MARRMVRPVFVVGSPRSGTTLVQNLLCRDPSVYRLGRESRFLWHRLGGQEVAGTFPAVERIEEAYLSEVYRGERPWTRDDLLRWARRCASQGTPPQYLDLPHDLIDEVARESRAEAAGPFAETMQTETAPFCLPPLDATFATQTSGPVRVVDKDTGHCWRLPQLATAFPDAQFVFVVRDPLPAITSLVAGWRHPTWFFTYRMAEELAIRGYSDELPWGRNWWNFNLFPGYEEFTSASLAELCAEQWSAAMRPVVEHGLPLVEQGRALFTTYEELVASPHTTLEMVSNFTGLDSSAVVGSGLDRTYMSMLPSTWDPGDSDAALQAGADAARSTLAPVAHLLGLPDRH